MILSIIVAASENNVIGKNNELIWHLSADLKRFKTLTTGHTIVMGRKTYESIGKPLPNRRNIVISHNLDYDAQTADVINNIDDALALVENEEEVFLIGGGTLYNSMWDKADRLYLTLVHTNCEGDTFIPGVDKNEWREISRENHDADEKNEFAYSFINYERIR